MCTIRKWRETILNNNDCVRNIANRRLRCKVQARYNYHTGMYEYN